MCTTNKRFKKLHNGTKPYIMSHFKFYTSIITTASLYLWLKNKSRQTRVYKIFKYNSIRKCVPLIKDLKKTHFTMGLNLISSHISNSKHHFLQLHHYIFNLKTHLVKTRIYKIFKYNFNRALPPLCTPRHFNICKPQMELLALVIIVL